MATKKDLTERFCENFVYVDAGNLYLLETFLRFVEFRKHFNDSKWKEYIP